MAVSQRSTVRFPQLPDGKLFLHIGIWALRIFTKMMTFEAVIFAKPQNAYFKIGRGGITSRPGAAIRIAFMRRAG